MIFRHSGKLGDIIYSLAAVSIFNRSTFYINSDGHHVSTEAARQLLPLLEHQSYIGQAELWSGQPYDHDFDSFRLMDTDNNHLACSHLKTLELASDLRERKWLSADRHVSLSGSGVVFARSSRNHGSHSVMKALYDAFGAEASFVGSEAEWHAFTQEFGPMNYLKTPDMLNLAEVLASSKLFIGNQSAPLAIAEGLKIVIVQEVNIRTPNCVTYRRGSYPVWCEEQLRTVINEVST